MQILSTQEKKVIWWTARWPITATAISKRNTLIKRILIKSIVSLTRKKDLLSFKKGLSTKKKDLHTQKTGLPTYTKNQRQIPTADSCSKFPRQIHAGNSQGVFSSDAEDGKINVLSEAEDIRIKNSVK